MASKKIPELKPDDPFLEVGTVNINRSDVRPRPELPHYEQKIWELRREFIMSSYGRIMPTIIIISHKTEYYIMQQAYANNFRSTMLSGLSSFQQKDGRQLFDMRLIVSNDVAEDEIIIK